MGTGKLIPFYNTNGQSTYVLGMAMNQNRLAVPTWSYAMEVLPPMRIIELGTANGGFITALGFAMRMQHQAPLRQWSSIVQSDANIKAAQQAELRVPHAMRKYFKRMATNDVITFDLCKPDELIEPMMKMLDVAHFQEDYWQLAPAIEATIVMPGTTFLLCDGGNKQLEFARFASAMKPGDVIAAHDYDAAHEVDPEIPMNARPWQWSEIKPKQVEYEATKNDLEPWLQEYFDLAGWLVYRKKA